MRRERCALGLAALLLLAGLVLTCAACDDDPSTTGPSDTSTATTAGDSTDPPGDGSDAATDTFDGMDGATDLSDADRRDADTTSQPACGPGTDLARRAVDPAVAERGWDALTGPTFAGGIVPELAVRNLWIVWGTGPLGDAAYWAAFGERYGFHEAPFDNDGLPMGLRDAGDGNLGVDCLACHADVIAGEPVLGAANTRLDLESLYDDLVTLNELAPMFGYPSLSVPFELDGFTGAAGSMDAFGLAMELSLRFAPSGASVATDYGHQRATAWWTVADKDSLYADATGAVNGHRTMMATTLAFANAPSDFAELDSVFEDIGAAIAATEPPCWPFEPPASDAVARGNALFDAQCAGCHGIHTGPEATFPNRVVPVAEVGTDPTRAQAWTSNEMTYVNASWFGEPPMRETDGYLAQPLRGIWARAPYLHNGSVPTLRALLRPDQRPTAWRRVGSSRDDYDPAAVGWRVEVVEAAPSGDTRAGRQVFDSNRTGLSNVGHMWGSDLNDADLADLLAYLTTL